MFNNKKILLAATLIFSSIHTHAATINCDGSDDLPSCVAEISNMGGGTVFLSEKTYYLTETLNLQSGVDIVGQSFNSVISWDENVRDTIDEPLLFGYGVNDISLKNFKLRCFIDQDSNSSDLRNDHMGLFIDGDGDPSIGESTDNNDIYLESVEAMFCSHGIHIKGATGVTAIDLKLHDNGNTEIDLFHNIYFRRVADLTFVQRTESDAGLYDSPRGHGIRVSHVANAYLENLSVYNNADHGLHLTDGIYNVRFHDLNVYGNCANPSGTCNAIQCYGSCDIDSDADKESYFVE